VKHATRFGHLSGHLREESLRTRDALLHGLNHIYAFENKDFRYFDNNGVTIKRLIPPHWPRLNVWYSDVFILRLICRK